MNRPHRLRRIVAAAALSLGIVGVGAASTAHAQLTTPSAAAATTRSFSCTGIISRDYTRQTVTGTLTRLRPSNVSVFNYLDTLVHSRPKPALDNGWWSGYWKTSYQLNQWKLGKDTSGTVYHLMLPDTAMGGTFSALLVSEFGGGAQGNWQNWMSCTAA